MIWAGKTPLSITSTAGLEERVGKENPILAIFRQGGQILRKNPAEGPARQNLITVKFLPKIDLRRPRADGASRPGSLEANGGSECSGPVLD